MKEYLRADLVAAGIDPDSLEFGGNAQLAVGSASTISKNLKGGLSTLATHTAANGSLTNKPLEKFLDANIVASSSIPTCPSCQKHVFKAEEILYNSQPWHKDCFRCGLLEKKGCSRHLTQGSYETHHGVAYCTGCFAQLFSLGAARGTVLHETEKGELFQSRGSTAVGEVDVAPETKASVQARAAKWNTKLAEGN